MWLPGWWQMVMPTKTCPKRDLRWEITDRSTCWDSLLTSATKLVLWYSNKAAGKITIPGTSIIAMVNFPAMWGCWGVAFVGDYWSLSTNTNPYWPSLQYLLLLAPISMDIDSWRCVVMAGDCWKLAIIVRDSQLLLSHQIIVGHYRFDHHYQLVTLTQPLT